MVLCIVRLAISRYRKQQHLSADKEHNDTPRPAVYCNKCLIVKILTVLMIFMK